MAVYVRSELWMELNFNIEVVENEFVKESRYYYYFRRNVYIYVLKNRGIILLGEKYCI